jgi:hypothetical protein
MKGKAKSARLADAIDRLSYTVNLAPEVALVAGAIEKAGANVAEGLHDVASALRESAALRNTVDIVDTVDGREINVERIRPERA